MTSCIFVVNILFCLKEKENFVFNNELLFLLIIILHKAWNIRNYCENLLKIYILNISEVHRGFSGIAAESIPARIKFNLFIMQWFQCNLMQSVSIFF